MITISRVHRALELRVTTLSTVTNPGTDILGWQKNAACSGYDPEWWYPEPNEDEKKRKALRICNECPVRAQCLMWSFVVDDRWGILGGQTQWNRTAIRHRMERSGKWKQFVSHCMTQLLKRVT